VRPYHAEAGIVIYHGDALELLATGVGADAVVTDPPYGFKAYDGDDRVPVAPVFLLAPTVALFGYPETLVGWCLEAGRVPTEWISWWPTNARVKAGGRHGLLAREVEAIAVFGPEARLHPEAVSEQRSSNRPRVNGEVSDTVRSGDVWRDASPGVAFNAPLRLHPNEKPLSLLHKLVAFCSSPGDLVVDPFMGSGTTLRACKDLGRRAIGIDKIERNCEVAARRLAQGTLIA
jgi:site-specific DNA-methyltransferase (adenine-specific)